MDALRTFWESITAAPPASTMLASAMMHAAGWNQVPARSLLNQMWAFGTLIGGTPGFFRPRLVPPFLAPSGVEGAQSFYDTQPLRDTLERLVDFDRINSGAMRFSAGAVSITSGNFVYFDTTTHTIDPRHVMASGALPPGLPAVEIDGESYWDGGLVSNTPLQWVLESQPRQDTLAFQVDLWSAKGEFPQDLVSQDVRLKDIRFSSRTRQSTDQFCRQQSLRRALARLLARLPDDVKAESDVELRELQAAADDKVYNIAHLIYRAKPHEGASKDYEFSRATMEEHWASGYEDAVLTLRHPEVLQRPASPDGVGTFDLAQLRQSQRG